jgi:uncharacterized protein (TIGR02217 family)
VTAIFPSLPGLSWSVSKEPRFATRIQRAVNGRELRVLDQPNPSWSWTLTYEILRDGNDTRGIAGPGGAPGGNYDELRTLMGFFLQQQGAYRAFLFEDPSDNSVTGQPLGIGNASTTRFQLVRTMGTALPGGGYAEAITAPNTVGTIYFDGIRQPPTAYSVDADTGIVTFTTPPPTGRTVTADFTYCFRVRFADDSAAFEIHGAALVTETGQAPIRLPVSKSFDLH